MKFHRTGSVLLVAAGVAALAACSSLRVATDWDRQFDFASLHTYSWARSDESDAGARMPFLDRRIKRAVDLELAARGYQRVESGGDFLVVYSAKVRNRADVTRYRGRWHGWTSVDRYKEGTLLLGVVDRGRDEIVWSGWAEGIVSDTGQSEEEIQEACAKILAKFPPS